MKVYAVFLFDDNKQGFERYTYLEDIDVGITGPEQNANILYVKHYGRENAGKVKATTLDMRVTINDIKFASQTTAYIPRNGGKAIVLAERFGK